MPILRPTSVELWQSKRTAMMAARMRENKGSLCHFVNRRWIMRPSCKDFSSRLRFCSKTPGLNDKGGNGLTNCVVLITSSRSKLSISFSNSSVTRKSATVATEGAIDAGIGEEINGDKYTGSAPDSVYTRGEKHSVSLSALSRHNDSSSGCRGSCCTMSALSRHNDSSSDCRGSCCTISALSKHNDSSSGCRGSCRTKALSSCGPMEDHAFFVCDTILPWSSRFGIGRLVILFGECKESGVAVSRRKKTFCV